MSNYNTRYLAYCAGEQDRYFSGHKKEISPSQAKREVALRIKKLDLGQVPSDFPKTRKSLIFLTDKLSDIHTFTNAPAAIVSNGGSYFGSGGYVSGYRVVDGEASEAVPTGTGRDNGFMSEADYEIELSPGAVVYAYARDYIGNGRTFRSEVIYQPVK